MNRWYAPVVEELEVNVTACTGYGKGGMKHGEGGHKPDPINPQPSDTTPGSTDTDGNYDYDPS